MTVQPLLAPAPSLPIPAPSLAIADVAPPPFRVVRTLVTLGDSTPVGVGDPVLGGRWRGFPVLLAAALGASRLVNTARPGARMAHVYRDQLPVALAADPDVAIVFVGMNDTLRSDFDPAAIRADAMASVSAMRAARAHVLLVRYHDHTRVFRLPAPLQRALSKRIAALNEVVDSVAATDPDGIGVLDVDALPGSYDRAAWAVDRLHPSERGHRMLADGFATLLAGAGFAVPAPVSLDCAGGREITAAHRAAWLVIKGLPWLVRRSSDLGPVIVQGLVSEMGRSGRP